jgi:hypothetical protein
MSKDTFKSFARLHPELANTVLSGNASWQQLYEIFEIYGENNSIWNNYLTTNLSTNTELSTNTSLKDVFNSLKNLDMDSVQKGISNLQKTIGMLQDIGLGTKTNTKYEPRPLYKHFED